MTPPSLLKTMQSAVLGRSISASDSFFSWSEEFAAADFKGALAELDTVSEGDV